MGPSGALEKAVGWFVFSLHVTVPFNILHMCLCDLSKINNSYTFLPKAIGSSVFEPEVLHKKHRRNGRKEGGRGGTEEGEGRREGGRGRASVDLEEVLVELRIQHSNFRLDVFVQDQREDGEHGVDGGVPRRENHRR